VRQNKKPPKKTDRELWCVVGEKIKGTEYVFTRHAEGRQAQRQIDDLTVLNILENNGNARRKRNKKKDEYRSGHDDWNYCIEGYDHDNKKIRIIISFDSDYMLIITVINISQEPKI